MLETLEKVVKLRELLKQKTFYSKLKDSVLLFSFKYFH